MIGGAEDARGVCRPADLTGQGGREMGATEVVLRGTLRPDGMVELEHEPGLPPGPVRVRLEALDAPGEGGDLITVLERIHASPRARGAPTRTAEEIEASRRAFREEVAEHMRRIAEIQDEARRAREQSG